MKLYEQKNYLEIYFEYMKINRKNLIKSSR